MLFVALMTFILIMSSVTMVLAVNEGHKNNKNKSDFMAWINNCWRFYLPRFSSLGVGTLHS